MPTHGKFAVVTFCCFAATAQTWKPLNQGLPKEFLGVSRVAVSTDGSVAYAVSTQGSLLSNSGQSGKWKPLEGVVGVAAVALAAGPNPMVYAATNAGIRVSSDNGKTWKNATSANAQVAGIGSIAVDPGDAKTAYAAAGGQVLKTTDGGATWAAISSFASGAPAITVSLDPVNPLTLYASTVFGGISKTVDGGQTWTAIKAGLKDSSFGAGVLRLTVDPKNPSNLYAGSFAAFIDPTSAVQPGSGTVSKSSDGGQTWTPTSTGIPSGAFVDPPAIDPANSSILYAGFEGQTGGGVLKSTDAGATWSQVYTSPDDVADVAAGSGIVYAAHFGSNDEAAGGIMASTNGGQAWAASNQGLKYFDLRMLALDPSDAGEVYAGGSGGLFRKTKGTDFASLPVPAPVVFGQPAAIVGAGVTSVTIDAANPEVLYANTASPFGCFYNDQLLFKSADGGKTWSNVSPQDSGCVLQKSPILIDPHSEAVYIAANDFVDGGYELLKSADGGATWNMIQSDSTLEVSLLMADPNHAGTLYAGLLDYSSTANSAGLSKSTDGGVTWNATGLTKVNLTALAIDPTNSNTLFASSAQAIYKSTDGGATWNAISQGLSRLAKVGASITALAIDPGNDSIVYASTSGAGIYMTSDGGTTWVSVNDGLTSMNVSRLAASAVDHHSVYALTPDGVFKLSKQ